jgi:hypothetical protein
VACQQLICSSPVFSEQANSTASKLKKSCESISGRLGGQSMVYEMEEMSDTKVHFVLKGRISMLSDVMMRFGSTCDL